MPFQSQKSQTLWQQEISKFASSGLNRTAYCQKNNLSPHQMYYWCKKLRPDLFNAKHDLKSKNFLRIKTETKYSGLMIEVNDKIKISFHELPSPSWFSTLIQELKQ